MKATTEKLPPSFLCSDGRSIQSEVQVALPALRTINPRDVKLIVVECIKVLKTEVWSTDRFKQLKNEVELDEDIYEEVVVALYFILRRIISDRVSVKDVKHGLKTVGINSSVIEAIATCVRLERFATEDCIVQNRISPPKLERLNWRVDLTLTSSSEKSTLRPSVSLRLTLSNGEVVHMEASVEMFHKLRYNVAKLLSMMQDLERHPMMKIMERLEREEKKQLE